MIEKNYFSYGFFLKFLILLVVISHPSKLKSEVLAGTFYCKVVDTKVINVNEGKSYLYKDVADGYEVGLNFSISYSLNLLGKNGFHLSGDQDNPSKQIFMHSVLSKGNMDSYVGIPKDNTFVTQVLSKDLIKSYILDWGSLEMYRYYKNDWQGILTKPGFNIVEVVTFDCRNPSDTLEDIFNYLKKELG